MSREKLSLSPSKGRLSDLHPARYCGLAAYFLSGIRGSCELNFLGFIVPMVVRRPRLVKLRKQECWLEVTCQP
jgi:hypothetical protein